MTLKMKWEHLYLNWFLSLHTNQAVSSVTQSEISDCTELNRSLSDMIWEMSPVPDVRKFYGISLNNYTNCLFRCIKQLKNSTKIAFDKITKKRSQSPITHGTSSISSPPTPSSLLSCSSLLTNDIVLVTIVISTGLTLRSIANHELCNWNDFFWFYFTTNSQLGEL